MSSPPAILRIGTRASPLALVQTMLVERRLRALHPSTGIEIVHLGTLGDQVTDRPLAALGERAVFVTAIEEALRHDRIDLAVHSAKDLPSQLPDDMQLAALLARADPRDALVTRGQSLRSLPAGARVGTSSPRRACQIRALRPDLLPVDIRGNVGTRLDRLRQGEYDAVVLAVAGLDRLGRALVADLTVTPFSTSEMIPAAAQGALAIEIRRGAPALAALLAPLEDRSTAIAVSAERAFLATVGGGCHAVVAAFGAVAAAEFSMHAMVGAVDGRQLRGFGQGSAATAETVAVGLGQQLLGGGGAELLTTSRGPG